MSPPSVIIVGSGAGGSVAAWELARAGHEVLIFEKGRDLRGRFSNDEVKANRFFEVQDPLLEPRTRRSQDEARRGVARSFMGDVNDLATVVGGGTVHWDAKVPRFWRQDFKGRSLHGPVPGANLADWPLTYEQLEPFYDEVERRLGVQGDRSRMPKRTLAQAPRRHRFAMAPNPPMLGGTLLAKGAESLGYHPYPFPQAVNSRRFDGRPPCNSCGYCSGYGCAIDARGSAWSFLRQALHAGARLRPRCFVYRIDLSRDGRRAVGVSYLDGQGRRRRARADVVVVAASAIETARLLLLSRTSKHPNGLGNRSGELGRNLMFHHFTQAGAVFTDKVHSWRGPSTTVTIDDFVGPDKGPAAKAAGLPYLKGGICEVGGTLTLLSEAKAYAELPNGWGRQHKDMMRAGLVRDHIAGLTMVGEDLPQRANRVDLDPSIRDVHGFPVPRITYSAHRFELAAAAHYGPKLQAICQAAPGATTSVGGFGDGATRHVLGTARMGRSAEHSVVDAFGRAHDVEGLVVADGSVFVTSGGFNPSLTIMALALRAARHIGK